MILQVFLGWPTSIAISPVDGTLHILDKTTNLVLKVTPENKVAIVAGRPSHCPEVIYKKSGLGLLGKLNWVFPYFGSSMVAMGLDEFSRKHTAANGLY